MKEQRPTSLHSSRVKSSRNSKTKMNRDGVKAESRVASVFIRQTTSKLFRKCVKLFLVDPTSLQKKSSADCYIKIFRSTSDDAEKCIPSESTSFISTVLFQWNRLFIYTWAFSRFYFNHWTFNRSILRVSAITADAFKKCHTNSELPAQFDVTTVRST